MQKKNTREFSLMSNLIYCNQFWCSALEHKLRTVCWKQIMFFLIAVLWITYNETASLQVDLRFVSLGPKTQYEFWSSAPEHKFGVACYY